MYLLKRLTLSKKPLRASTFTFHNVPIKTKSVKHFDNNIFHLHSTMYLLKRVSEWQKENMNTFTFHNVPIKTEEDRARHWQYVTHLHSTMYLLKHSSDYMLCDIEDIYIPQCTY